MIPVAYWRDPANGRYRGMIRWIGGKAHWAAGSDLDLLKFCIESEYRKLVPAFIEVQFEYIDLGWRSSPTIEEIERELQEALAA